MDFRTLPDYRGHKLVAMIHDEQTGLHGFIAIHNDVLGPALGGTRMYPYPNDLAAVTDVLRLSRGMTYKAALAGVKFGGGKAVLVGDPKKDKNEAYLRAYGRRLNYLNGAFLTGEDVGIAVADIEIVAKETPYVNGRSEGLHDGVKGSGDPSPVTARGVLHGIRAALETIFGNDTVTGRSFAIQGLGKVGFRLARLLHEQGARLIVADVDDHMVERALTEFRGSEAVEPEEIHRQQVDVYSPCALGAVLNDRTLPELQCRIVAEDEAEHEGRTMVERLKDLLPKQQFAQALQAKVRGRIIARETIPAQRKDVTGYLYGGDRTRKMKLWKKQKRGKERLKQSGRVELPPGVFKELLKK